MIRKKNSFRNFISLFPRSYRELIKNDPLRMAGATAFFTTFALPFILIILIEAFSLLLNPRKISHQLFADLSQLIGRESTVQTVDTLIGFRRLAQNANVAAIGFIFMLFVASTLFLIIKRSINQIWKIAIVKKESTWQKLRGRFSSILIILASGILFLTTLIVQALQSYLAKYIVGISPRLFFVFNDVLNYSISVVVVMVWFAVLFRFLPDGRPAWKVVWIGSLMTSILFNIGKFVLHALLTTSNLDVIYRTSGAIAALLLFVFYSSLILYYGATFTLLWSEYINEPIHPRSNAAHYKLARIRE